MIIWLASYPKNGNTWVRLFLDYLLSTNDDLNINKNVIRQFPLRSDFNWLSDNINNQNVFAKNCIKAQIKINLDNKIKIFKTHNAFWNWNNGEYTFTNEINTLGIIYIVRDPRNVVTSVLNYFQKNGYEDAIDFMKKNRVLGGDNDEHGLPTIIGSWSSHYKSWKKFKKNYLLIKYENLLEKPKDEFFKITKYLNSIGGFNFKNEKILKAIDYCDFKNLSKLENLFGFDGNTDANKKKGRKFFDLGPNNNFHLLLNDKYRKVIENIFKDEMEELKYL